MRVAYGCVTNSLERVQRYVLPRVSDRSLTLLWNQTSMSEAYNRVLDAHVIDPPDVLIMVHDDLELVDPHAEKKFAAALHMNNVGVVGVCGGYDVGSLAWWNARTVGHQLTDSGILEFGPREGDVESLEGSVMAFGRWAIESLRFDKEFTGFHGYDHIGLKVTRRGRRVWVADVDTHHHTGLGFDSPASGEAWARADELFRRKYLGG